MATFDYLLDIALVGLVVVQLRGRRLDTRRLLLPLVLVAWAAVHYLHGIPTAGNDGFLVAFGVLAGLALGVASGVLTRLGLDRDGVPVARATVVAAALWVLGVGARMGFAQYAEHGGGPAIGRFSTAHHLTGPAWATALILMAFAEVASRTVVLWVRSRVLVGRAVPTVTFG